MSATIASPVTKIGTDGMAESGNAAVAGFQELAKAYQALATKNAERLFASLHTLAAVKSPSEFAALQARLMNEAVDAAVKDSANIARLTADVFTAALEPITKTFAAISQPPKV